MTRSGPPTQNVCHDYNDMLSKIFCYLLTASVRLLVLELDITASIDENSSRPMDENSVFMSFKARSEGSTIPNLFLLV